jgi:hypothetical protein
MDSHQVEGQQGCTSKGSMPSPRDKTADGPPQNGRAWGHQAPTLKGSLLARSRTHSPGHFRSPTRSANGCANDRSRRYSRRTLTAACESRISKAVDHGLVVPAGIKILSSVCSSRKRTNTADPEQTVAPLNSGRSGRPTGDSARWARWQPRTGNSTAPSQAEVFGLFRQRDSSISQWGA